MSVKLSPLSMSRSRMTPRMVPGRLGRPPRNIAMPRNTAAIDWSIQGEVAVVLAVAVLMGFEGSSLRRWTLSRGRWRQLDIVVADDADTAERRFFERWSKAQHGIVNDQWAVDRGGPPPTRHVPGQQFSNPPPIPAGGIIGLFPEPGGSR